ncbi:hypothetical protein WN55_10539 [Dufourea novaeangliae]|uniref:Uncharacterized protein n=1 Tax=Dufourea novaeangliae TaxID=178035 RepID=A0A154P603_DUFNO|nr:hypothetical protein WN55_10539 [Dufourea novaeangliae]
MAPGSQVTPTEWSPNSLEELIDRPLNRDRVAAFFHSEKRQTLTDRVTFCARSTKKGNEIIVL